MSDEIFTHKHEEDNGDIVEMHAWHVPISPSYPEGVAYSFVYIRNGKRLVGYDNENHGKGNSNHHRHLRDRIAPHQFIDLWTTIADFANDLDKIKRGAIE